MIAAETRTVELAVPADPANLDSEAKVRGQGAGSAIFVSFWFFLIEVECTYIIIFISGVRHSDSAFLQIMLH